MWAFSLLVCTTSQHRYKLLENKNCYTIHCQYAGVVSAQWVGDWQWRKTSLVKYEVRLLNSSFHYYECLFAFEVERERERVNQVSLFNSFGLSQIYSSVNQLIVGQGHKDFSKFLPDIFLRQNQLHDCLKLLITLPAFGSSLYSATKIGRVLQETFWFSLLTFLLTSWFSSLEWLEVKQSITSCLFFLFFLSLSFRVCWPVYFLPILQT